jgi:hypothetical protein
MWCMAQERLFSEAVECADKLYAGTLLPYSVVISILLKQFPVVRRCLLTQYAGIKFSREM